MSPTIFRAKGYRFYFLSNEEPRMHVHVTCERGEAKFWLEPLIALAMFKNLDTRALKEIQRLVEEHRAEIVQAWNTHFGQG
jgi:hypothetical protein